jgi:hypothetical protein
LDMETSADRDPDEFNEGNETKCCLIAGRRLLTTR